MTSVMKVKEKENKLSMPVYDIKISAQKMYLGCFNRPYLISMIDVTKWEQMTTFKKHLMY